MKLVTITFEFILILVGCLLRLSTITSQFLSCCKERVKREEEEELTEWEQVEQELANQEQKGEERAGVLTPGEERAGVLTPGEERAGVLTPGEERAGVLTPGEERAGVRTPAAEGYGQVKNAANISTSCGRRCATHANNTSTANSLLRPALTPRGDAPEAPLEPDGST